MSTPAKLFIDPLPEYGDGARRYLIDYKWSVTRLIHAPVDGGLELSEPHLISVALQKHEDECGKCNLGRFWREHGDLELKELADRTWEQLGAFAMRARRN